MNLAKEAAMAGGSARLGRRGGAAHRDHHTSPPNRFARTKRKWTWRKRPLQYDGSVKIGQISLSVIFKVRVGHSTLILLAIVQADSVI